MDIIQWNNQINHILTTNDQLNDQIAKINQFVDQLMTDCLMEKKTVQWIIQSLVDVQKNKLDAVKHLVCHRADVLGNQYTTQKYLNRSNKVNQLKNLPQPVQKSQEWYQQRSTCLTATSISTVIDEDPYHYPIDILFDKCGQSAPFIENADVHHGKKYEQIGTLFYSFRNHVKVAEYGLLQSNQTSFIAASPDGICESVCPSNHLTKMVGRLLEIKFPRRRRIITTGTLDGEICPHYYYVQVQTQLYVTQLDECDFLQCKVEEYDSYEDYVNDGTDSLPGLSKSSLLEKGCLIQLLPKANILKADGLFLAKYIYPPKLHMTLEEIEKWVAQTFLTYHQSEHAADYVLDRVIYWKLSKIACHLITADKDWFNSKLPMLHQFWDYVQFYRQHPDHLTDLIEWVQKMGKSQSKEIFQKIHTDFSQIHPNENVPLYQKPTYWRKQYNQKFQRSKIKLA